MERGYMPVADGFFPSRMSGYTLDREVDFYEAFGVAVYHLFFTLLFLNIHRTIPATYPACLLMIQSVVLPLKAPGDYLNF
jgi:hypothetical protein